VVRVGGKRERAYQAFTADRADPACDWPHRTKTFLTDGQAGNVDQGSTAETAIRGEQRGEQACGDAAGPGDQWALWRNNPGPGGPNWGTVTAEDDPPSPSRCYGGSDRTNLFQYSGAAGIAQ